MYYNMYMYMYMSKSMSKSRTVSVETGVLYNFETETGSKRPHIRPTTARAKACRSTLAQEQVGSSSQKRTSCMQLLWNS